MSAETQRVLWYAPTEYDALKHGPPYLPVSMDFRNKSAAFYDSGQATAPNPLVNLLGLMQALTMLHQVHHWSTRGSTYYADHLLFERLYNESVEFIDGLAERLIGLDESPAISLVIQAGLISTCAKSFGQGATPDEMVTVSLNAEQYFLSYVAQVIGVLEASGELTHGLSNMLEGVADKHESFVYLLKQRSAEYTYQR